MLDTKGDRRERARRRARFAPRKSDPTRFIGHRYMDAPKVNGMSMDRFRKGKGK